MTTVPQSRRTRRDGSIREVAPGRWIVRLSLAEIGSQRIRINRTIRGTKGDAQRFLNEQIRRRDEGFRSALETQRVGEWCEEWVAEHCTHQSERTRADSRGILRRYLTKELRARKLMELTTSDVQRWINALVARPLAPRTVRLAHSTLRSCLTRAVKLGKVSRNAARDVDLPRQRHVERAVLSPEQATRFLSVARDTRWEALFFLLLHSGLRPGEALGLMRSDLDGSVLRVRRALVRIAGQQPFLSSTKTGRSRSIPLGDAVMDALRRHRVRQLEQRLLLGATYQDRGLIFAGETGGYADDHNINARHFKPLLTAAGLPSIRLYDLRHSCATLLLAAGEHPKVVQERLGHSTIALTLDVYSHVVPGMQERASEKLEALLHGTSAATEKNG